MLSSPKKSYSISQQQDYSCIPEEMFLHFPNKQQQFYQGEGKTIRRFIFHGIGLEQSITKFQKDKFQEFLKYIQANKKTLPMGVLNDPFWTNSWKFRWLSSEQFQFKATIKSIEKHSQYLKQNRNDPSQQIIKLLKMGLFYVCGRDAHYRPILVFNIQKMLKSKITEYQLLQSQKFFFEKILNYYLLPAQVQSWVAIIDVGYQNLASLVGPLKQSIGFLSNTFRSRMKVAYLVRCPNSINFIWAIVKRFMHKDTIEKINFMDSELIPPLMQFTNPSQIQIKYGGTQPNLTQFWPTRRASQMSSDYSHPNVKLNFISTEKYCDLYSQGRLNDHWVNKQIIGKFMKQIQEQENTNKKISQKAEKQLIIEQRLMIQNLLQEQKPINVNLDGIPAVICWQTLLAFK